ncbi:hypothetical protein MKEN_00647000 [Mycena kentingensis (nom. inval.)]|nr:hypothetical protein MKEN_00647000 [Mycena kentingensis (nom. inval.)]
MDADGASINSAVGAHLETENLQAAVKAELVDIVKEALKPLQDQIDKLRVELKQDIERVELKQDIERTKNEVLDQIHEELKPVREAVLDDTMGLLQVYKLTAELANGQLLPTHSRPELDEQGRPRVRE